MFDVDALVADCLTAVGETEPRAAVKEVLESAMAQRAEVATALHREQGFIEILHASEGLTVLNVIWGPGARIPPHEHRMWAAIAIYGGREDNTFYRRAEGGLTESGGRVLRDGDVRLLGDDTIHAVTNPLTTVTGAIHVYGGNLPATARSEWDAETFEERPYDVNRFVNG